MPDLTAVVTARILNLRRDPSTANPPIARLARGTGVEILETLETWYRVKTEQGEGYVHGDYLSVLDPDPCVGFLNEREDLRDVPPQPAPEERIRVTSSFSNSQRGVARTWNRQGGMLGKLSEVLEIEPAASVAVLYTESNGSGFAADGRLIIRFENHVFWRRWGKRHPEVFRRHFQFDDSKAWQRHRFRADPDGAWQSFHGRQSQEWKVLEFASRLDDDDALRSISMGAPQIMGFNHSAIGYDTPRGMFDNFSSEARYQVFGLFDFLKGAGCTSPMLEALRRKRFEDFAARYNGPGQAADYGHRIERYYDIFHELKG